MDFTNNKDLLSAMSLFHCKKVLAHGLCLSYLILPGGCAPTHSPGFSPGHISLNTLKQKAEQNHSLKSSSASSLSPPINRPPINPHPKQKTYTVVVSNVIAKDLLFSLARDANINLDIHNDIQGRITLNAIDKTLPEILERISKQIKIRYEFETNTLRIRADTPYLKTYTVDYVNISRVSKGIIRVATNIGSTGQGNIGKNARNGKNSENNSSLTEVLLTTNNQFWETLSQNIFNIINDETKNKEADANVIVNRETGLIIVRATKKQHTKIKHFIHDVLSVAKRQVMIEATIAEIKLSDRYQAGVDWSIIASKPNSGVNFLSNLTGSNLAQSPFSKLSLSNTLNGNKVSMTLKALEEFGDVQVLSSPKVMAINNQPAILKVVDNIVYFEIDVNTSLSQTNTLTTFDTEIKTVPVGFVMSVTPFINEQESVTLNIRPTISRVIDHVADPNPAFANADVVSKVPVIQIREIESILTIDSGDTAVIGGLMQDTINNKKSGVPFLSSIPFIGSLFRYDDNYREKSELIIFIRPVVIHHASLNDDLSDFQTFLPVPIKPKTHSKTMTPLK